MVIGIRTTLHTIPEIRGLVDVQFLCQTLTSRIDRETLLLPVA
jgi:hypothetical protein